MSIVIECLSFPISYVKFSWYELLMHTNLSLLHELLTRTKSFKVSLKIDTCINLLLIILKF